ncbi:MAG: epimerase [Ignavibacteria bacterium GWB2_35_12]|nr:MAG: epimerase [Ignavibacteria bacterium GWA2_35_8]OGU39521.1 MAG: epimerase [Ignavibacteria bacterium GWB2_35_12]OGU96764.1 MAG: epimerase [Ignavibacteria bacterium RIFOXYA2_FULL_35_10]OGV21866.1 MAG: epimerase [Ignavibacteria bacterium RIFOXYC2_FULL_35_21]
MLTRKIHAVTGAYGYSGKYIARRLLEKGHEVITLSNTIPQEDIFNDKVKQYPLNFNDSDELCRNLEDVDVLYNTYWVRFNYKTFSHEQAVDNTIRLFNAGLKAGVRKIVHVSITNPSENSHLSYFKGKAILERELKNLSIQYSILRPAVLFGKEDILINNIAWMLRKFPLFGVFGDGEYKIQPIFVDDLALLAIENGATDENKTIDAIGPETFSYNQLVEIIKSELKIKRKIIHVNPKFGYFAGNIMGKFVNDVVITKDEIDGLMSNLLFTNSTPAGVTKLSDWVKSHAQTLGLKYANELKRRK